MTYEITLKFTFYFSPFIFYSDSLIGFVGARDDI